MKRLFSFFLIFCGLVCFSWGAPFEFGLKAGGNYAWAYLSAAPSGETQSGEWGFIGGAYVDLNLVGDLSLQPELDFSMKGTQFQIMNYLTYNGSSSNITFIEQYNYLEMPILLKASIPLNSDFKLSLLTGPSAALLLAGEVTDILTNPPPYENGTVSVPMTNLNTFDFGWVFGLEGEYDQFIVDLRWTAGLTPIYQSATGGNNTNNNVISLQAGYRFL